MNRLVFTRRNRKREASNLIHSATGTSFTQCLQNSFLLYHYWKRKTLSLASKNQRKYLMLSPQPESPQKTSWESVSFPPKPPVLTVLRSIRPHSRSPSLPILQKFGAITLHHHPPPFLQVPRTHPSKRIKTTTALHAVVMNTENKN
jgi:hypothetical protein